MRSGSLGRKRAAAVFDVQAPLPRAGADSASVIAFNFEAAAGLAGWLEGFAFGEQPAPTSRRQSSNGLMLISSQPACGLCQALAGLLECATRSLSARWGAVRHVQDVFDRGTY